MARLLTAVLVLLQLQLSTQFYANLCFNRKRNLDCSMEGPGFTNRTMNVLSVTMLLSSDAVKLQSNNDGRKCTNVEYECRTTVRENKRREYNADILAVNDYVKKTCNGKASCYLEIPNWTAINGTAEDCVQWFPDEIFHLRGVYLDIECVQELNQETSTISAETFSTTEETTPGETTPEEIHVTPEEKTSDSTLTHTTAGNVSTKTTGITSNKKTTTNELPKKSTAGPKLHTDHFRGTRRKSKKAKATDGNSSTATPCNTVLFIGSYLILILSQ